MKIENTAEAVLKKAVNESRLSLQHLKELDHSRRVLFIYEKHKKEIISMFTTGLITNRLPGRRDRSKPCCWLLF